MGAVGSSGNLGDPAQVGSPGSPVLLSGNFADGTLSSQSDYQPMDDSCQSDLSLRLSGESLEADKALGWLVPEGDPAFFPKARVLRTEEGTNILTPCLDCQGRILRVIDLGEKPNDSYTLQKHKFIFGLWVMALTRDTWDPELVPAATYRDFIVNASGDVDLGGQEMIQNHLYYFLISKQAGVPVTEPTAFVSVQEFNAMASCPKKSGETGAFEYSRLIHALDAPPIDFKPVLVPLVENNPSTIILKQNFEIIQGHR